MVGCDVALAPRGLQSGGASGRASWSCPARVDGGERLEGKPRRERVWRGAYRQGLITRTPRSAKCLALRVATAKPRAAAESKAKVRCFKRSRTLSIRAVKSFFRFPSGRLNTPNRNSARFPVVM